MVYHILYIQMTNDRDVTRDEMNDLQKLAAEHVEEFGYNSFSPLALKYIGQHQKKEEKESKHFCNFLYLVLQQLVLREHYAAEQLNLSLLGGKKDEDNDGRLMYRKSIPTPFGDSLIKRIDKCLRHSLSLSDHKKKEEEKYKKSMNQLIYDLYKDRDVEHLFINKQPLFSEHVPVRSLSDDDDEYQYEYEEQDNGNDNLYPREEEERNREMITNLYNSFEKTSNWPSGIGKNDVAIIALDFDYNYIGHIYAWPSSDNSNSLSLIGIRSSLDHLYCRSLPEQKETKEEGKQEKKKKEKVSQALIIGALLFAKENGFSYLKIFNPLTIMRVILSKFDFFSDEMRDMFADVDDLLSDFRQKKVEFPTSTMDYGCLFPQISFSPSKKSTKEKLEFLNFLRQQPFMKEVPSKIVEEIAKHYLQKHPKIDKHLDSLSFQYFVENTLLNDAVMENKMMEFRKNKLAKEEKEDQRIIIKKQRIKI
jgi:hypothetical protein